MQFNCVKVITPPSILSQDNFNIFEADFIYLPNGQPKDKNPNPTMPWHASKIFDTQRDKILELK
jgi:hypothetical protein